MTTKPHVHAEVIKAWADGAQVQYRKDPSREWVDMKGEACPSFWVDSYYRVKPETIRYRVALFRSPSGNHFTNNADTQGIADRFQARVYFVRWLTDWTEVEA